MVTDPGLRVRRSSGHLTVSTDEEIDDALDAHDLSYDIENKIFTGVVAKTYGALRPVVSMS